jgi:cell division septation protein DedD
MDQKLKERVFGALVVVAIAVIFVPMLLDKKHDEAINISEAIPTPPIEEAAISEPPQQVAEMEASLTAENLAAATATLPQEAAPKQHATDTSIAEVAQAPAPAQITIAEAPAKIAKAEKKQAQINRIQKESPIAMIDKPKAVAFSKSAPQVAEEAEKVAEAIAPAAAVPVARFGASAATSNDFMALNDETGMSNVAEFKPAVAAPTIAAVVIEKPVKPVAKQAEKVVVAAAQNAAPESAGWAVQMGTFANHSNAKALERKLREKGYSAFLYEVEGSNQRLTRVLVGPSAQRQEAANLVPKLEANLSVKGVVIRYEPLA